MTTHTDRIAALEAALEGTIGAIDRMVNLIVHFGERLERLERELDALDCELGELEAPAVRVLRLVPTPEPAEAIPAHVQTDRGGLEKGGPA
jgi:hypothetical protein